MYENGNTRQPSDDLLALRSADFSDEADQSMCSCFNIAVSVGFISLCLFIYYCSISCYIPREKKKTLYHHHSIMQIIK